MQPSSNGVGKGKFTRMLRMLVEYFGSVADVLSRIVGVSNRPRVLAKGWSQRPDSNSLYL